MNDQEKKPLVPELRFPEFQDSGDWSNEPLDDLYDFEGTNSLSRDQLNFESGSVKNIHYGDIHTKFFTLFDIKKELVPYINPTESLLKIKQENYCVEGDIIFADASEDLDDVGKTIEIVNLNSEKLLAGLHTFLARQKHNKLIIGFGGHLFKSNRIRKQIKNEAQGAKVLGISKGRVSKIDVAYPPDKLEQQKIRDCLSSLDKLITAHTQKHEALKAHKKGLMQQIFPTKGETIPKLRFPEFQDSGDWDEKPLKNVFSIFQGFAFSSKDSVSEGIRWLKIADVSMQRMNHNAPSYLPIKHKELHKKFSVKQGDYVLALTRPILRKQLKIAPVDKTFDGALLNQRVGKLVTTQSTKFVYYLLQTSKLINDIDNSIAGSEPPNLSAQQIEEIITYTPDEDEQQKIADCLSSVDELISAQAQKVESLKAHKKGLMQRLFPSDENGVLEDLQ